MSDASAVTAAQAESVSDGPEGQFVSFPGSPFQLFQPYPPAGDQPTAIDQLVEGVEDGLAYQTLLGVTGSGKTYTMANVIARLGRPAIVFAPNKTLAAQLYSEFREFFPKNAVEYFVSYYDYYQPEAYVPQRDLFIEKDSAINEHIEQMRLSATKSVLERRDTIVVASVSAIYGIGKPEDYTQMRLIVRVGDKVGQRDLIAHLIRMQYTRNDMDFGRGTFRVRGDTIDVFPAEHSELAVRIELFDDEVEALMLFDPLTGRIRQKIPRFTVYPSSHYVTPREQVLAAVDTIKEELRTRLAELVGNSPYSEAGDFDRRCKRQSRSNNFISRTNTYCFQCKMKPGSCRINGNRMHICPDKFSEFLFKFFCDRARGDPARGHCLAYGTLFLFTGIRQCEREERSSQLSASFVQTALGH